MKAQKDKSSISELKTVIVETWVFSSAFSSVNHIFSI